VRRNGTVVVPIAAAFYPGGIFAFASSDGGSRWSATTPVGTTIAHLVAGGLRADVLPSAQIDRTGTVYVVWQDCRFRPSCSANDIVMATISRSRVSPVLRIPIDPTDSGVDHFIPAIAVDRTTGGRNAHLALTYYYYPVSKCSAATCQLHVGYVSSTDGGMTWSAPTELAGPIALSWLPNTTQGRMVGDYISGSFSNGSVYPVFAVANAPNGNVFDEAMHAPASGLPVTAGTALAVTGPILSTAPDHAQPAAPATAH
jgi:hypothetical protein